MLRLLLLHVTLFCFVFSGLAQTVAVSGTVLNADTKETLPFANVSTIGSKLGTATNGEGEFVFNIRKSDITSDTLLVSFIGFKSYKAPLKSLKTEGNIFELIPTSETLDEFVLSPLTVHEFMKRVVEEIPNNMTSKAFSALGYYSDKAKENEGYLGQNEAVIKSYFPNFSDTTKNQHQVVLYNERKDLAKLQFMAKKLKKKEKKYKKELEEKGDDSTEVNFLDPRKMFGGLNSIMAGMYIGGSNRFLDTTEFHKYEFEFHHKPIYSENGDEITLIHAQTKRRINKFKAKAKIYIDRKNLAIIKMEVKGDYRIPLLLKPLLFIMGIGVKNPKHHYARSYQSIEDSWYPKDVFYTINLNLVEKKLFQKNIRSTFNLQQVFSVQHINIESPKEIQKEKQYTGEKTLADQVFPEDSINWASINKVQF